jgi:hypothetical protein
MPSHRRQAYAVTDDGGTWQAKKDTTQKPPRADWTPLALPGGDAITPAVRGTYREGETYSFLNIVALDRVGTYAAEPVYNGRRAALTIERVERASPNSDARGTS